MYLSEMRRHNPSSARATVLFDPVSFLWVKHDSQRLTTKCFGILNKDYFRRRMKIAIASGKGGTGKTTVAVNLAALWAQTGERVTYVDCDVEEPDGHLFLNPLIKRTEHATVLEPIVNNDKCDGCGKCSEICNFHAIVVLGEKALTFPEMCHSCGGCSLVCVPKAIVEVPRHIGIIDFGKVDSLNYIAGKLRIGEAMPGPLIRAVKQSIEDGGHVIFDAPPGTSCPVVETVKDSDYLLLVTEPTPFGLNDLELAVEMARTLRLPHAVLVNRSGIGDDRVHKYCADENIHLIAEIPDDRKIAEAYSRGEILTQALPEYRSIFNKIIEIVRKEVRKNTVEVA